MGISIGDALLKLGVDKTEFDKSISQAGDHVKSSMEKMQTQLRVVGAAFTAMGVAGLKMAHDTREINATLGSTAITVGVTTKEMRALTLATTNVTFPIKSVAATFDILARAGMRNTDEMKAAANAFDALADATGSSAEVMAGILIPALKAMGEDIPQTSAELDKFTWLTKNTTTELSEFGSVMDYVAMYGADLNVTLDDMIAIMAVLESKGKGGATATRLFRTAVTQAADGSITLNEALGITTEEIEKYRTEINAATGLTDKHAAAMNEQYGFMDKLKQKLSEFTFQVGSFLTPFESMFAGITALGPVMMFLSTSIGRNTITWVANTASLVAHTVAAVASKIAIGAVAAAQWLLNAAMAANPIGIVIVAITALVAAGIALWKNWDKVVEFFKRAWSNIKMFFLNGIYNVLDSLSKFTKFIPGLNKLVDSAKEKIQNMIDAEEIKRDAWGAIKAVGTWAEEQEKIVREQTEIKKEELDKQRDDIQEAYDKEIDELRKTYGVLEDYDRDYQETKMNTVRRTFDERRKSIDREMDVLRNAHDESIAMIDAEYSARLRLIDDEAAAEIAQLNYQIDNIRAQQDVEDKARQDAEDAAKKANLERTVEEAKTDDERAKAEEVLANFITEQEIKARREQRDATIDSLRDQIDAVRANAETTKDIARERADREIAEAKRMLESKLADLQTEKDGLDEALRDELIRLELERQTAEEVSKERLDNTLTRIEDEKKALDVQLEEELIKIAEHVKNVNAQTAQLKDRTITITTMYKSVTEPSPPSPVAPSPPSPVAPSTISPAIPSTSLSPSDIARKYGFILPMAGGGVITEPTLLSSLKTGIPYAVAGEAGPERVSPMTTQTANITIMLDSRVIGRAIGQPLVDEIRVKTGVRI